MVPLIYRADIDPIVCSAAISAAFVVSEYIQYEEEYTRIVKIILANNHPIVKVQGIAAINGMYTLLTNKLIPSVGPRTSSRDDREQDNQFGNHKEFQKYTIQLIQSMIFPELSDLSGLLVRCLSCILGLDPSIVYSSPAMDLAIHYFITLPEHPEVRHTLLDTISAIVPTLCMKGRHPEALSSIREKNLQWLEAVLNMVKGASQRPKGDPLITVSLFISQFVLM